MKITTHAFSHILYNKIQKNDLVIVDQIVSIEFLDLKVDLVFCNTMLKTMIHGPCGLHNLHSPCMKDGM